ncbi:hypothetical protein DFP72DRAFT_853144 [Ephemerocybe angulata]|uniref:Uncharacterized protein n=1 Tax=Ephemerocybe angulata TaxID=980116 RepID=A0A8H6LYH1_9AGAR|nr:hypothetical protein DFP72DRAFT_853144 [Tulosesus angulatus]
MRARAPLGLVVGMLRLRSVPLAWGLQELLVKWDRLMLTPHGCRAETQRSEGRVVCTYPHARCCIFLLMHSRRRPKPHSNGRACLVSMSVSGARGVIDELDRVSGWLDGTGVTVVGMGRNRVSSLDVLFDRSTYHAEYAAYVPQHPGRRGLVFSLSKKSSVARRDMFADEGSPIRKYCVGVFNAVYQDPSG